MSEQFEQKAAPAGEVRISEHVIRSIASLAAAETEGIAGLVPASRSLFGRGTEPVVVRSENDMVDVTIRLILKNGYRLPIVAEQVQQRVKKNVQSMTGVIVSKVHVIASDIRFED